VWNDGGQKEGKLEGAGAGGGGCSGLFSAPSWQQSVAGWSAIGCGSRRAVADVAADGDPYTGVAVYDSTADPNGNKGWAVIGGTSVSSPIIASIFALAGGAHGVPYPARTLYEKQLSAPATLHDVSAGSNGECLKPFNAKTGASGCTSGEEAQSCSARGICLAGGGYDGPSGVGTPNGIGAFQLGAAIATGGGPPPPSPPAATPPPPPPSSAAPPPASAPASPPALPVLSRLKLTRSARIALRRRRPRISRVDFGFALSAPTQITVTLARRVRGRAAWRLASPASVLAATGGGHRWHLTGRRALARGRYQLKLTPARGRPASIIFQV
jgi:hypothetical protein